MNNGLNKGTGKPASSRPIKINEILGVDIKKVTISLNIIIYVKEEELRAAKERYLRQQLEMLNSKSNINDDNISTKSKKTLEPIKKQTTK